MSVVFCRVSRRLSRVSLRSGWWEEVEGRGGASKAGMNEKVDEGANGKLRTRYVAHYFFFAML